MPVKYSPSIKAVGQDEFHIIDKVFMRYAFDIHNEIGRFFDEQIYKNALVSRLKGAGFSALCEVAIHVIYEDFTKLYYLDLIVNESVIYELKTVEKLNGLHENQLINYLLLTELNHGKLVNFRTNSVESRFVSTKLNNEKRRALKICCTDWKYISKRCEHFEEVLRAVLDHWGAFLELGLYREAIIHFLGGEDRVVRSMDILNCEEILGKQTFSLLDECTAFHLSALSAHTGSYEKHLLRLLNHTHLKAVQWVNLNKNEIVFKTISLKK